MEATDIVDGVADGVLDVAGQCLLGGLELGFGGLEAGRVEGDLVDLGGQLDDRVVAALPHPIDDARDGGHEGREVRLGPVEKSGTLGRGQLVELEEIDHRLVSSAWT